jgi:glycosyltransferase involved in cell wall biosynthesis
LIPEPDDRVLRQPPDRDTVGRTGSGVAGRSTGSRSSARILYLTLEAPLEGRATFAHVHEIIRGLRRRGYEVILFAPSYSGRTMLPPMWRRVLEYARLQVALALRLPWADAVYIRAHFMALPAALLARLMSRVVVHEINGPYDEIFITYPRSRRVGALLRWMQRTQYRHASGLVAVTEQLKVWVEADVGKAVAVAVIPNGANTEIFHSGAACAFALNRPYAVFFGGLARWQGLETLVAAAAHLAWPNGVRLVVVGDGQERAVVQHAVAENPRITWLGRLDYAKVSGVVAGALCSLVPKNNRGNYAATGLNPLKIFETLAAGVPAVVTDFPGQADLVRELRAGLVIPADDPAALAAAVAKLAADPTAAGEMGRRGAAAIRAHHSWDARAAATAAFIDRLWQKG